MSNCSGGLLFLMDVFWMLRLKKNLPPILFGIWTTTRELVFLVTVGGTLSGLAHFNFKGGMMFLHVLNPVILELFYILAKGEKKPRWKQVLLIPTVVLCYLLFDYTRFLITGEVVYELIPKESLNVQMAFLAGVVTYVILLALGALNYFTAGLVAKRSSR